MMKGAEAIVKKIKFLGRTAILKERIKKKYRISELDMKLRLERTKNEARLLHKAKLAGVNCPAVLVVDNYSLIISYLNGKRSKLAKTELKKVGNMLSKLHQANIIHGDFTPANILVDKEGEISVIDFGLGFISSDIEDKAVDVFTFLRTIKKENHTDFLSGYKSYVTFGKVLDRVSEIEKRVRYAF